MEKLVIGFDAKRAYQNRTGLGNFSRYLLSALQNYSDTVDTRPYAPRVNEDFNSFNEQIPALLPSKKHLLGKAYWRTYAIREQLQEDGVQLFHGLSNEIPVKLPQNICSLVTIHDLIFLRFPSLYKRIDRSIYHQKFLYACRSSDAIMAISEQTKEDIVDFFDIDPAKIQVFYQDCNPRFQINYSEEDKLNVRNKFNLPEQFVLCVGTVEKRKNQLEIIKALHLGNIDLPLIIIGRQTEYQSEIENYITTHNLSAQVTFLQGVSNEDLPIIYQLAHLFVYPSVFEGFGIPILEALNSGVPVVTSKGSCFSEVGGDAAQYAKPLNTEELIEAIRHQLDTKNRIQAISRGNEIKMNFRPEKTIPELISFYQKLIERNA